jgi:hypothetical protein
MGAVASVIDHNILSYKALDNTIEAAIKEIPVPAVENKEKNNNDESEIHSDLMMKKHKRKFVNQESIDAKEAKISYKSIMDLPISSDDDELLLNANTVYLRLHAKKQMTANPDFKIVSLLQVSTHFLKICLFYIGFQ